jgi:hypothetical protein
METEQKPFPTIHKHNGHTQKSIWDIVHPALITSHLITLADGCQQKEQDQVQVVRGLNRALSDLYYNGKY